MKMVCWSYLRLRGVLSLSVILLALAGNSGIKAQNSQGTILGRVTDQSGSVVAGASLKLTNRDTGVFHETKTNSVGDYVFVNIIPGNYDVRVEASGFKKSEASSLRIDVETTLRQDFQLTVGEATEMVTVTAESQMVQTDNVSSGTVVRGTLVDALPISGRDFTNLLRLQAGATEVQGSSQLYWAQHGLNKNFTSVSVNGARTESVSFLVDGVSDNDQYFSTANNIPNSGAIEEFKVQNGLYSAEYGQGSAQVNVAIKSGANQYHGMLYDFIQNSALQPKNVWNAWYNSLKGGNLPLKDSLVQNQYGFTFGGPVSVPKLYHGQNRTFFFFAFEEGRKRQSATDKALVPTQAERGGDFSDWRDASGNLVPIYDPATETGGNPTTRQAFANNKINSSRFSAIAQNYLKIYPLPNVTQANMAACAQTWGNGSEACYNYVGSLSKPLDTDNDTFRLDHNFSNADRLYFTGILGEQLYHNPNVIPLSGSLTYQRNHLFGLNWDHTLRPTMLNSFRIGYNWQIWENGVDSASSGVNYGAQLGFQNAPTAPALFSVPDMQINGYREVGTTSGGWRQKEGSYQLVENLKWTYGRHALTFGTDIRRVMLTMMTNFGTQGQIVFNGAYTGTNVTLSNNSAFATVGAGSSVADLLLGNPIGLTGPNPGGSDNFTARATNWNFFVQDDYRVTSRLTLNLGLRYEIPPSFHDISGGGAALDMTNGGGFLWTKSVYQQIVQNAPGYLPNLVRCCAEDKLVPPDHKDIAPRIGVAWRPFDTNRFVVRSGYGIFYDLQNGWYGLTTFDNLGTYVDTGAFYPTSTGSTVAAPTPLANLWLPSTTNYSFFNANPYWVPYPQINWPKNRSPYNQQWTLDTQFALTNSMLLDVGYLGNHGLRQPGYWYYNAATMPAIDDPCDRYRTVQEASGDATCAHDPNFSPALSRAPFPNFSTHAYAVANIFSSNYNALQVRLTQRYTRGLQYQVGYTWSRTIDQTSAINNIPTGTLTLQNNNCTKCDYGPSSFDQTHRFVASGVYEFPVGKGKKFSLGPANWIVGGWSLAGNYTLASGLPETLFMGYGGNGEDGVRADLRRPNLIGNPKAPVYGQLNTTTYWQALFQSDIFHWFNPAAYGAPAGNQYGTVGRNTIRQPYFTRGDMSFAKSLPVTERHQFQYRLEIFNVFSPWHAGVVNGGPNGGGGIQGNFQARNFGSLVPIDTDASGNPLPENLQSGVRNLWTPRVLEMTLKYIF